MVGSIRSPSNILQARVLVRQNAVSVLLPTDGRRFFWGVLLLFVAMVMT
jgi:hypothetical protein